MRRLKQMISVALLCATTTLSAQNCCPPQNCDPCCDWFSDCEFSVLGEYLYWDICSLSDDLQQTTTPVVGERRNIILGSDYQSGYRVGGLFQFSCWEFGVRYTSLDSTKEINQPLNATGDAFYKIQQRYDYSVLDITLGREINIRGLCGSLTPFIGLKFGWIDLKQDVQETSPNTPNLIEIETQSDFNTYGINLGANFQWQIWKECIPVSFITRASMALLKGTYSTNGGDVVHDGVVITSTDYFDSCAFSFVPNIYVGLDFELFCCDCFWANAQIGYEAELWTSFEFVTGALGATLAEIRKPGDVSLNGLVVRLQIGF